MQCLQTSEMRNTFFPGLENCAQQIASNLSILQAREEKLANPWFQRNRRASNTTLFSVDAQHDDGVQQLLPLSQHLHHFAGLPHQQTVQHCVARVWTPPGQLPVRSPRGSRGPGVGNNSGEGRTSMMKKAQVRHTSFHCSSSISTRLRIPFGHDRQIQL